MNKRVPRGILTVGVRGLTPTPLAKVKLNETFYTQITIDYTTKTYQLSIQTQTKLVHSVRQPFKHDRRWTRGINFYFGGNRTAPQKVQVSLLPIKSMPPFKSMSKTIGHESKKH